ncbi:CRISPR-associated protein [Nitrobacter sp. Nb-311A]|uniref:type I-C CRISPR-associated protein Cas8c/Csd1 n=1 Tax=Nitrobacter sp. Nb-311A TaxID=314253 RepID=UPI0000687AD0|nr:type I-C CRISPR-associated protein Cas8c/Csd1 [Nitrobacter sp. Nb-311A]EAQ36307.1 CRISPR-associated protein [Nitrobacter sp. Nb-311A]
MSILAALAKAYDRIKDAPLFGYSAEKIGFVISLSDDGAVVSVTDLRSEDRKKSHRLMQVPQPSKKSVNISPNFLWGNTSYTLGITARDDKKSKRLADEHAAFVRHHLEALNHADDVGLVALRRFLEHWTPTQFADLHWPDEVRDQNVVFALESERRNNVYLHDRLAAKSLWEKLNSPEEAAKAVCLINGDEATIARLHPSIKGVWGAQSSGASIVAFNQESFESYGHEQGDNAPVSEAAVFRYTTALNAFLAKGSRNRIQIGDASTVFWADASDAATAEMAEDAFAAMFEEVNEEVETRKVGDILERIRKGQPLKEAAPELSRGVRFHVLGLAPNAARLSIRFWFDNDFGVLAENYQQFVADMQIEPPPREPNPPLWRYLIETAVLGKRENVHPNLAGEWMRSILTGAAYPQPLLATVLMRIRADGEVNALRVAILKALVIRNFKNEREASVSLDLENKNKGYLLGRLFAAYEYAQARALGDKINATIKDKFYGAASAQPRKVFAILEKNSANHLSKVGRTSIGSLRFLQDAIGGIMEQMSPGDEPFPASLSAQEQSLFGLGYYHQRNEFFKPKTNQPAD